MTMQGILLAMKFCIVIMALVVHGSTGYTISPSLAIFPAYTPVEERKPFRDYQGKSLRSSAPSPVLLPNGSALHIPVLSPSHSAPVPLSIQGLVPYIPPILPIVLPPHEPAPLPQTSQVFVPSLPPTASHERERDKKAPVAVPHAPVPIGPMPREFPWEPPSIHPIMPRVAPSTLAGPTVSPISTPSPGISKISYEMPVAAHPNKTVDQVSPVNHTPTKDSFPFVAPTSHRAPRPSNNAPASSKLSFITPARKWIHSPTSSPSLSYYGLHHARKRTSSTAPVPTYPFPPISYEQDPASSPVSTHAPSISPKRYEKPVAAHPNETINHVSPVNNSPSRDYFPIVAPTYHKATSPSNKAPEPSKSSTNPPTREWVHSPAYSPSSSFYGHHHARKRASSAVPAPSYSFSSPTYYHQGPVISPPPSHSATIIPKEERQGHQGPSPSNEGPTVSPALSPFPSAAQSPFPFAPSLFPTFPPRQSESPALPPKFLPSGPSQRKAKTPGQPPVRALPPPPPNQDCTTLTCTEPLTNSLPGSPCLCVWPMKVGLRLSVALYTFFPLVSELAQEIAAGVFLKQSQVRIMGADAASDQPDKTIVLFDLVPLGEKFDNTTAFFTFDRFWHKKVAIKTSFFGDYDVLYVRYLGLPPSPPSAPSSITTADDGPYGGHGNNGRTIKPLGVDVSRRHKDGLSGSVIAIIVLSSLIVVFLCIGAAWYFILKCGHHVRLPAQTPKALLPSLAKPTGPAGSMMYGNVPSSASLSFGSSIATYTGSAKTFSANEIEKATHNFDESRILGEGGFGRVYSGILDDGTTVAVKVLKRDDHQGGREFLAEVEMLSRLHHRNLVKLIGICTEDHSRCLVYELIPNGSVESHLHGVDKETAPLDWGARVKIALGAARGLAYLHEDSSPRVIHRDFKSSNILLEHDFTPKVSDFGLARTALDEGSEHISTRVMGTFGYVAPEYAMTGHLLVKSDVYSYGVVLLELLSGRKPIDMSQPQGQENLVAWARPLLTSKDGLEIVIDPALGSNFPFDSLAKVAAIASMCVQPEVSHRPFMGEVVQALKLVCNECDETKEVESTGCSREELSIDIDGRISSNSGQIPEPSHTHVSLPEYNFSLESGRALSVADIFSTSARFERQRSGSFRRYSSSGPLRTGRPRHFWQRIRGLTSGSTSEHAGTFRSWA